MSNLYRLDCPDNGSPSRHTVECFKPITEQEVIKHHLQKVDRWAVGDNCPLCDCPADDPAAIGDTE